MEQRYNISWPLVLSATFFGIAAIVIALQVWTVVAAGLAPGIDDEQPGAKLAKYVEQSDAQLANYRKRIEGRSIFYKPSPTPKPRPVVQPTRPERPERVVTPEPVETVDPGPPPPPREYTGPRVLFAITSEVRFAAESSRGEDEPFTVRSGEERNGVRVINTDNLPGSVRIGHRGGEYDVEVYKKWSPEEGVVNEEQNESTPARTASADPFIEVGESPSSPKTNNNPDAGDDKEESVAPGVDDPNEGAPDDPADDEDEDDPPAAAPQNAAVTSAGSSDRVAENSVRTKPAADKPVSSARTEPKPQ